MKPSVLKPLGSRKLSIKSQTLEPLQPLIKQTLAEAVADFDLGDLSKLSQGISQLGLSQFEIHQSPLNAPRMIQPTSRLAAQVHTIDDDDDESTDSTQKADEFLVAPVRPYPIPITSRKIIKERNSFEEDQSHIFKVAEMVHRNSIIQNQHQE